MTESPQRKRRVGYAVAVCLGVAAVLAILFPTMPRPSLESLLRKRILNPMPAGMRNIQKIYYFYPSLGDGSFVARFESDDQAHDELLHRWAWSTSTHPGGILRNYTNLIEFGVPFYEYDDTNRLLHIELQFSSKTNGGIVAGSF